MRRRDFVARTGMLLGAASALKASAAPAAGDAAAIKQVISDAYSVFYTERNRQKYRALLTEDYLLLEQGQILDVEGEDAMMPAPGPDYARTDTFDFHTVKVTGDVAYVVYVVESTVANKKKESQNGVWRFLESAILRRSGKRWRLALLHSTQITRARA